ncbi:MAG: NADH-quinone oxidoreductase subunit H [Sedimentisphaerales bacterium]|nr:NADH-quinone oxidoreductase subunit H [Sedimentisphaerales bacterium]
MNLGLVIPVFAGATTATVLLGLISKWIDRKVTAWIQWRKGPPWYQPLADIIKLLGKETIVPHAAGGTGFLLMPLVGFATVSVAATILWWSNLNPESGFIGDVIVVLYLLTIPAITIILGGSASGNPLAAVGAAREMKLLLAYELPMLLVILAAIFGATTTDSSTGLAASFQLGTIKTAHTVGFAASLGCVIGFLISLMCIQAKLGLVPFDMVEAECEIATGPFIEYSGAPLAIIHLTRVMLLAVMPLFIITIFWGGFSFNSFGMILASLGKYVLVLVVLILVRNTNPRIRIDHALRFFWYILTPLAIVALTLSMAKGF